MAESLPPLKNFILPGGGKTGARLHLSRAVCRRLERGIVELNERQKTDSSIIIYFNRLSDLLFTMARFANFKEKKKDKVWEKKQG
jgi:cob(I)alamin adenosyltransferase